MHLRPVSRAFAIALAASLASSAATAAEIQPPSYSDGGSYPAETAEIAELVDLPSSLPISAPGNCGIEPHCYGSDAHCGGWTGGGGARGGGGGAAGLTSSNGCTASANWVAWSANGGGTCSTNCCGSAGSSWWSRSW